MSTWLGDARAGKFADNLSAFGRCLRRAGLPVDASRIALAQQALLCVQPLNQQDVAAALAAVFVSREQDRAVFSELFAAFFKNPEVAQKLLAQMLPSADGKAPQTPRRPRVAQALTRPAMHPLLQSADHEIQFDAAMTASSLQRLKHADFNQLDASEYQLVERLARELSLELPRFATRRTRAASQGASVAWPRTLQEAARSHGEVLRLFRRQRVPKPLPLCVLVDVSGSMERYARLLLAYLHAATRHSRRHVFSFGNSLTPLNAAFACADTDYMLAQASQHITDFAGGTQLGAALATLRREHPRVLIGRRTLVLLISDGLDTGDPADLARELQWLKRHSGPLVWLNPLMRYDAYQPSARAASVLATHAHAMLAVHNLASLTDLAAALTRVLRGAKQGKLAR